MKLFKKKEKEKTCCNCNVDAIAEAEKLKSDKGIKILGSGCAKCQALEKAVRTAVEELALDYYRFCANCQLWGYVHTSFSS